MWVQILIVVVLMLVNAALSGSEMALVTLREGQVRRLAATSANGRRLQKLTADPNLFLSTIQVGITLSGFLASATAAVALAEPLVEPLGFLGGVAEAAAIAIVTLILSYATLVVGELAPKRIAMQRAEGWALRAARPVSGLAALARPAVWLLAHSTNAVVRLFGLDPNRARETVTEEEIRDMIAAQDTITAEQRGIMTGALEIDERRVWQVLIPRGRVLFLDGDLPASEALSRLVASGRSRAPVVETEKSGELAGVVGTVHLRDLVGQSGATRELARPAVLLPDSARVLDGLRRLREDRSQMAVVVDEFGSIAGIVTIADLLEEIVGEIYDEFDPDQQAIAWSSDGSIVLPGSFSAHDLTDIGIDVDTDDSATVAGVVLEALGHIPIEGEHVECGAWTFQVVSVAGHSIKTVRVARTPRGHPPTD